MSAEVSQEDVDEALRLHSVARAAVDEAMGFNTAKSTTFGNVPNAHQIDPREVLQKKVLEKASEIITAKGEIAIKELLTEVKMRCECSEPEVRNILNHYININRFMLSEDGLKIYNV